MKKILFVLFVCSVALVGCKKKGCTDPLADNYDSSAEKDDGSCQYPDTTYIPDQMFELFLIDSGIDEGTVNGWVLTENVSSITELGLANQTGINDLTGIEDFANLSTLSLSYSGITNLDLSNNNLLTRLTLGYNNNLISLDLSSNPFLERLDFYFTPFNNALTSINFNNPMLKVANIEGATSVASLDFSSCPEIYYLRTEMGGSYSSLDLRNGNSQLFTYYNPIPGFPNPYFKVTIDVNIFNCINCEDPTALSYFCNNSTYCGISSSNLSYINFSTNCP